MDNKSTKANKTKSMFPKQIQSMLLKAHAKGLSSKAIATKLNESKTAQRLGVQYKYRQIATTLGNLTRGNCSWGN